MNCPSRTDDTLLHAEWNQNPPFLAPDLTTRQDLNGISNARENKEGDGNGSGSGQSLASLSEKGRMNSPPIDPEKNIIWDNGASLTSKSGMTPYFLYVPVFTWSVSTRLVASTLMSISRTSH